VFLQKKGKKLLYWANYIYGYGQRSPRQSTKLTRNHHIIPYQCRL